jgi:hypothetical protein
MRATAGVFIWAIESCLLALFGVGSISLVHVAGGTSPIAMDMWVISIVLCSCLLNIILNTVVAFSSKQTIITPITARENETSDFEVVYMHKAVAQGHCSVVAITCALYTIILQRSLMDLNWASAYFPATPGLVWITGTATFAFLTVLLVTSITGAWAATAMGDSNTLFWILPTTSIVCIMFPIINEIGSNGLMVCSSPMVSTFAIIYANLALATSFTLSLLDSVEFDPVRIFPKFMRTVGDRTASFRVYNMIHGLCTSATIVVYWMSTRNLGIVTMVVLLSVNGAITLSSSLAFITTLMRIASTGVNSTNPKTSNNASQQEGSGSGSDFPSVSGSGSDSGSDSEDPPSPPRKGKEDKQVVKFGTKRRTGHTPDNITGVLRQNTNFQWPSMGSGRANTTKYSGDTLHSGMSIGERRIAILRLDGDQQMRTRHT